MMFGGKGASSSGVAMPAGFRNGPSRRNDGLDVGTALAATWLISNAGAGRSSSSDDCGAYSAGDSGSSSSFDGGGCGGSDF